MNKITHINKVIKDYFALNDSVDFIPAKDLMPQFIRAGIFSKDYRSGLPIRSILRQLDEANQLSRIPNTIPDRKQKNTYWYFGRTSNVQVNSDKDIAYVKTTTPKSFKSGKRKDSDEHYIIDLCDKLLGLRGSRQHKFSFLLGDAGTKLPVDVYYDSLNLVIEFNEQQHTRSVKHFDKPEKLTVSGVDRGEQRKIYDQRKRAILPQHGITIIDISYKAFTFRKSGKLVRDIVMDMEVVKQYLTRYMP